MLPFSKDKIFSVTEISQTVKQMLEGVFGEVAVEGEISNLKTASSGHIYFDLKDENALISAVLFKGYARGLILKEGDLIVARGEISCYIKQGRYQLIVKEAEVKTKGNLFAEFEKLKEKLSQEGLFDEDKKLPLPAFPSRIGVVTSPTGAAIRDILSVLKRRGRNLEIIIAPALVQGEGSKEQIVQALKNLQKLTPPPDVILLGRGGGSIEDLWSFNEEPVVRAVAASKIPIISCVGHETDFTLTDFAASLRAPTPSAAAELVVKNAQDTAEKLFSLNKLLLNSLTIKYERLNSRLSLAINSKYFKEPALFFERKEQTLDDLKEALYTKIDILLEAKANAKHFLEQRLALLSPQATLKRGYAIVRRSATGEVVRSSLKGEHLTVQTSYDNFEVETL